MTNSTSPDTGIDEVLDDLVEATDPKRYMVKAKAEAKAKLQAMVLDARIQELEQLDTRRHYGKDYQESLDEVDEYKDNRIVELTDQRTQLQQGDDTPTTQIGEEE